MDGELSESFPVGVRLRQRCVMSPWLFNILMDGCMREMKARVGNGGVRVEMNEHVWAVVTCLFAESGKELERVVDELNSVCTRRKLKVNSGISKVMIFDKREVEMIDL